MNVRALTSKHKSFATDVVWSMGFDGLTIVAQIVAFLLLGSNLGADGYGAYVGVFGVIGPLAGLAWAGVGLAALQQILRDSREPRLVASHMLGQGLLTGLGAVGVALIIGSLTVRTLSIVEIGALALAELLALNNVMISAFVLQAVSGVPAASRVRMSVVLLRLLIVLGLYATSQLTILNIGICGIIAFGSLTVWVLFVRLPREGIRVFPAKSTEDEARMAFSFALPMVGSSIQLDGDKTVLNAYGMADVAGVYGAAFRVVNMAFTPIRALNSAAHNRLLRNNPNARGEHVRRSARLAMLNLAAVLPIAAVLFFAVELLEPLLGDDFEESAGIARWLLLFLPLKAVSNAPLGGLLGLGRTTTRAWVVLTAAGVSLGLYVALIPFWSWGGAVVGTVIGELVLLLVGVNRLRKWQRVHDESVRETRPETITTQ